MVEQLQRFDPRISPFTLSVKDMASPQTVYFDKAANVRAERIEGIVHLYRLADIVAINRHPAVTGGGGRGGSFGNESALIPLEIDGAEHRKWRRLLDPMFSPKQAAQLENSVRELAADLIDKFAANGKADLAQEFCVVGERRRSEQHHRLPHSPVGLNETVEVTSGVESIGRSSCTSVSCIATTDGRRCVTVRTVQAVLGEDRQATRPWTDAERESLEKLAG